MNNDYSLNKARLEYKPQFPSLLKEIVSMNFSVGHVLPAQNEIKDLFPKTVNRPIVTLCKGERKQSAALRVGVVFSGGQAAGGHNVIAGLFDALYEMMPKSVLIGFLGGPSGIIEKKYIEISQEKLSLYRNQGGFDLIGSGRTKIETPEQLEISKKCMEELQLDGLVIVGGDDSNTNAAILAEYFLQNNCSTVVIGVPKTIDGDLQNEFIEISFGFDTACKTYAEMIGNIARDALSAKKYYHFIKLMGRSASHIALECALKTHPNAVLISEEVASEKKTLSSITAELADLIEKRAHAGKKYGVILIPEGVIEFIPEIKILITELNALLAQDSPHLEQIDTFSSLSEKISFVTELLKPEAANCFVSLPESIQKQLLLDRDPHGNVQVSKIETEKMFVETVTTELERRSDQGTFKGSFHPITHFFGYEGRAGYPSNFDANYCYSLGRMAALLIRDRFTGYMSCITKIHLAPQEWVPQGIPLTTMLNMETRQGKEKPVIKKALVSLKGKAFMTLQAGRKEWMIEDHYLFPGPMQFNGDIRLTDTIPESLQCEF
ncbi:MAG: diphosphate--fructose-6-phosphate 1-phosphotransferase [Parachlamydiales bacterium]|nr:diphosphate--fructose-6-phosphate 1-phosphotransferase [Parachlamydiales bacterium]